MTFFLQGSALQKKMNGFHGNLLFNCYSILELRRDIQAVIASKANLNLGPVIENYGGETFLSQEVTINLLQEFKLGFKRCQMVKLLMYLIYMKKYVLKKYDFGNVAPCMLRFSCCLQFNFIQGFLLSYKLR